MALDLPKPIALPLAPCICLDRKNQAAINSTSGNQLTSKATNHGMPSVNGLAEKFTPFWLKRLIRVGSLGA